MSVENEWGYKDNTLLKVDPLETKPKTSFYDNDFTPPDPNNINWKLMAERLWTLLDDIDTAFDHYKPNMSDRSVNYVNHKCRERQDYMISLDGQTLTPLDIPTIEELDPMCRWFKDAWEIEKKK